MTPGQVLEMKLQWFLFGSAVTGILAIGLSCIYDLYLDRKNSDQTIKELREENERLKEKNNEN